MLMRYCGREFSESDISFIANLIQKHSELNRHRLSFAVCEHLDWRKPNGELKDMSCRVAMLRMNADKVIQLPPATGGNNLNKKVIKFTTATDHPIIIPKIDLGNLEIEIVKKGKKSFLWNEYIHRYHYLGHKALPGAQMRYFIKSAGKEIALIGFGSSAWKVASRDAYIGWTADQRKKHLHLVINNARFLILPWIVQKNLASKILSLVRRRIVIDWYQRYQYRPVLLETFVQDDRFLGTCYRASNWKFLGKTKGRGKLDIHHSASIPVKSIWVYPLATNFFQILCS
jgi:hypothetical protein